ncbi:hypothetical protein [Saccharothrix sp. NRRL B-16314]|uniref:hypothetical protein n=1 Tax=Saccharothrix sp. NRRL B-16314 TaxID=1463825 RepID=UPI000A96D6B0|nr:hypothetical protein [Saccharothrix sp. NRRL B-16314]
MSHEEQPQAAGDVNWEAYSHEELYRMLWQDADVADVSVLATEWAQHRVALDTHAEVLREQRIALLNGWQGPAAEEAAGRLEALAVRLEKISELAHAGQRAAQEAADALATARAMMPPPPAVPSTGDQATSAQSALGPGVPGTTGSTPAPSTVNPWIPVSPLVPMSSATPTTASWASIPSVPNYTAMFSPTAFFPAPTTTTSGMGTAFGTVGGAGFSFYFGAATTDQQKAEAVRAMRTYESSLVEGSRLIDGARGAIPPAAPIARGDAPAAGGAQGSATGVRGGVPWTRLLGGGRAAGGAGPVVGGGPGVPTAGHGAQLGQGPRAGVLGVAGGPGMQTGHVTADAAAGRGGVSAAVAPAAGGRPDHSDDETHENRMPTIDHGLFTVDEVVGPPVIGQTTGGQG